MKHVFRNGLLSLLLLLVIPVQLVLAQSGEQWAWSPVWLDSTASVQLPYASSSPMPLDDTALFTYHTGTSDNDFYVAAYTLALDELPRNGQLSSAAIDQFLASLVKQPMRFFAKAKQASSRPVVLTAVPDARATYRLYNGFDTFHQLPAVLEMAWLLRGQRLYVLYCTYSLPQDPGAQEDLHRFFSSLAFKAGQP